MSLFHPIGFMLASPAESAEHALSYFPNGWVEDKYDGFRAQAHCSGDRVRFFSRTRDEITESFPVLPQALAGLPQDAILDGEIVAWSYLADSSPADDSGDRDLDSTPNKGIATETWRNSRARFSGTQKELMFGSTTSLTTTEVRSPTTLLTDDRQSPIAQVIRAPVFQASSPEELNRLFDAAQGRGNEGLMIKD